MKSNKLRLSHKNVLTIHAKPKKDTLPTLPSVQACSVFIPNPVIRKGGSFTSLDKENKKQPSVQKGGSSKQTIKDSLKMRAYSTHPDLKLSHNSQNRLQWQAKQPRQENIMERLVTQIISLLKRNYILTQNHVSNYTIRKDSFSNLIGYFLGREGEGDVHPEEQEFHYLAAPLGEIEKTLTEKRMQSRGSRLKMAPRVASFTFGFQKYLQDVQKRTTELQKLDLKKHGLLKAITELESLAPALAKDYLNLQTEIGQAYSTLENAKGEVAALQIQKQFLGKQIQQYKREVKETKEASQRIENYINSQNNKLIILASQEYKSIESDIYDYASYLQCNQLASSLTYEPLSVTCLTNELEDQLREINRNLVQNETMDVKEKGKAMRDFLLEWMNRFKKKDQEQKEIMKFKTKCVQNFIQKMKKWLQNWTLKQEYLVGLRDKFSMDTEKFKKLISELSSPQPFCHQCFSSIEPLAKDISQLYEKIQTNYKLGNSFY